MYLHTYMEDMEGIFHPMVGAIEGKAYRTERLNRFGYINLTPGEEAASKGSILGKGRGEIRAHEFHYFDSTSCGEDFEAKKPFRKRTWNCIHGTDSQLLGFPHLYYYGNPGLALDFLKAAVQKREE